MIFCSSLSTNPELDDASREAAEEVLRNLDGAAVDLCFAFVSSSFTPRMDDVPALLHERLQPKTLLGCSGGGIIGTGFEVEGGTAAVSLIAASLPGVQLTATHLSEGDMPDGDAPPSTWTDLIGVPPKSAAGFVIIPDPFSIAIDRLLAGMDFAYPDTPKVGGIASGTNEPGRNALFCGQTCHRTGAAVLGCSGNIAMDTMVAQGCKPFGKVGRITKAEHNMLITVDNKPATEFLQEQLQSLVGDELELGNNLPLFLGIAMDPFAAGEPTHGDFLIRNMLGFDPNTGSLAVGALLSVGRSIQFHLRDGSTSDQDLRDVLANREGTKDYRGALLFSCLGRGEHLYGEPHHDSRVFRELIGKIPLSGFFCNGEIGPVQSTTYVHGYTSSFGVFRQSSSQGA
ncbi:MAG: FIST signal transduction protein [Planctomycetota bacterium]|jgi:small ligand-binding sensory domain FIST